MAWRHLRDGIQSLNPAYFAMVMATGILAIALHLLRMEPFGVILAWINLAAYIILWGLTIVRLVCFPREMFSDLIDHNRGVGYFTLVAATGIVGSQFIVIFNRYQLAEILWFGSLVLWALFTYSVFTTYTVEEQKPTLDEGINGGWLVTVVATQAVSALATLLLPAFGAHHDSILFLALAFWLFGGMLSMKCLSGYEMSCSIESVATTEHIGGMATSSSCSSMDFFPTLTMWLPSLIHSLKTTGLLLLVARMSTSDSLATAFALFIKFTVLPVSTRILEANFSA